MDNKVSIGLTKEEAIVFFEFIRKFNENKDLHIFEDQSEQRVLWNIECILEKEISEPFSSDYKSILKKSRESVRDEE